VPGNDFAIGEPHEAAANYADANGAVHVKSSQRCSNTSLRRSQNTRPAMKCTTELIIQLRNPLQMTLIIILLIRGDADSVRNIQLMMRDGRSIAGVLADGMSFAVCCLGTVDVAVEGHDGRKCRRAGTVRTRSLC